MYLKVVDKFNEWFVTAFVDPRAELSSFLLHDASRVDESGLKSFFMEIYELYCKFILNPFYIHHSIIKSTVFDKKAQALARKYLP